MPPRILTCARIHRQNASLQPIDLTRLTLLLRAAPSYSQGLAVATDGDDAVLVRTIEELVRAHASPPGFPVTVVSVKPYGRFVTPLNAMVARAAGEGFDRVLFQSLEVVTREGEVEKMAELMDEDTLVVGKAFDSHAFASGENELTGLTTPWNTFAMWNVRKIALTGFLLIADGLDPDVVPATEEASAIALHQLLRPTTSKAVLVRTSLPGEGDGWETLWTDPERHAWHARKMATKISSVDSQLLCLGLAKCGRVMHVDLSSRRGPMSD